MEGGFKKNVLQNLQLIVTSQFSQGYLLLQALKCPLQPLRKVTISLWDLKLIFLYCSTFNRLWSTIFAFCSILKLKNKLQYQYLQGEGVLTLTKSTMHIYHSWGPSFQAIFFLLHRSHYFKPILAPETSLFLETNFQSLFSLILFKFQLLRHTF